MSGLFLAHAGEGATWQALLVTIAFGVAVIFVLALVGKLELETGNDLVLPLAVVAVLASVAPAASATLSDQVGWAVPAGGVLLLGLFVATYTDVEMAPRSWLPWVSLVVAVAAGLVAHAPLTEAWHPPATGDAETIQQPDDSAG